MIKKLSVVIPIYNEEANIPTRCFPRLMPVLENLGRDLRTAPQRRRQPRPLECNDQRTDQKISADPTRRARAQFRTASGDLGRVPASDRRRGHHARRRSAEPAGGNPETARQTRRRLRRGRRRAPAAARHAVPARRLEDREQTHHADHRHEASRLRLHAARLLARGGGRDQHVRGKFHVHSGAGTVVRARKPIEIPKSRTRSARRGAPNILFTG